MSLKLTSRSFENERPIPMRHSKEGGNISPQLAWTDVPRETRSLALIMDDPDAPSGVFVHWLVYGIPGSATELEENVPASAALPDGIRQGRNGFGDLGYGGPRPPSGTHRYFFHLYALDSDVRLTAGASCEELDRALQGHVLEVGKLMGRYSHGSSQAA